MQPFAVLFLYHRSDSVSLKHLELLRSGADGAPVVPLTDGGSIDGGIDVSQMPTHCATANKWATVDTVIYRWFATRQLEADRYIVVEWDCFLRGKVEEFYRPVWDEPFCAKSIQWLGRGDRWTWFSKSKHLFDPMDNFGAAPARQELPDGGDSRGCPASLRHFPGNVSRQISQGGRVLTEGSRRALDVLRLPR
jgi:hypothetical protein